MYQLYLTSEGILCPRLSPAFPEVPSWHLKALKSFRLGYGRCKWQYLPILQANYDDEVLIAYSVVTRFKNSPRGLCSFPVEVSLMDKYRPHLSRTVVTLKVFQVLVLQLTGEAAGLELGLELGCSCRITDTGMGRGRMEPTQVEQELRRIHKTTAKAQDGWGFILYRINTVTLFVLCAYSWQALSAEDGKVPVWLPVCHKLSCEAQSSFMDWYRNSKCRA